MESTFEIRRRITPYVFGLVVCIAFVSVWLLERFLGIGAEFVLSFEFTAFIFLFSTPIALFMLYLIVSREPVVAVRGDFVHITSSTLAWRKTVLPIHDIVGVKSESLRDTSHVRIVFVVTPECFTKQDRFGPWIRRKNNNLYLNILYTDCTPEDAVSNLRHALIEKRAGPAQ